MITTSNLVPWGTLVIYAELETCVDNNSWRFPFFSQTYDEIDPFIRQAIGALRRQQVVSGTANAVCSIGWHFKRAQE